MLLPQPSRIAVMIIRVFEHEHVPQVVISLVQLVQINIVKQVIPLGFTQFFSDVGFRNRLFVGIKT